MKKTPRRHPEMTSKPKHKALFAIISVTILVLSVAVICFLEFSDKALWDETFSVFGVSEYPSDTPRVSVHFVDVGQGDCSLIMHDGQTILIDSGEKGTEEIVIDYITNQGINSLDYVIATHPHSDHIGSLDDVINAFSVKNVIMPRLSEINTPTTAAYESLLNAVKNSGARVIPATVGATYSIGQLEMTVLSPLEQSEDINNMSVVVNLTFGETSFLFTGDAEAPAEKIMLNGEYARYLNADVLKVGHHGSSSSSSKRFLDKVTPDIAVISCGQGNDYGHPHKETVSALTSRDVEILRTDEKGTIVIESDGHNITY